MGYRRLPEGKAGSWIARHYEGDRRPQRLYRCLGTADDMLESDGVTTLTFGQAQAAAAAWFSELSQVVSGATAPITVQEAMEVYVSDYVARGGKDPQGLNTTIAAHIMPQFGSKKVMELTAETIRAWHRELSQAMPRIRSASGKMATRKINLSDPEAARARRATANRILTTLKAALSLAYRDGRASSDHAWRRVAPFRNANAPRIRFLTDSEASALVDAADLDFCPMIVAALLTGARYGELTKLRAADLNPERNTLHIKPGKTGKARDVVLTDEGARFFAPLCGDLSGNPLILSRPDGQSWKKSEQRRPMLSACRKSGITPPIGFHILRHTYASRLVRRAIPMSVIAAQIGDSETTCAKHYAHLCPVYVSEQVRERFGEIGITVKPKRNTA